MSGIPRESKEIIRHATKLGYQYSHATGGHLFYIKQDADAGLGQSKKLNIPSDIKGEGTARQILKHMGYFKAYDLDNSGQPLSGAKKREQEAEALQAQAAKMASRFVTDTRDWKKELKRHVRGITEHPGEAPERPAALATAQPAKLGK